MIALPCEAKHAREMLMAARRELPDTRANLTKAITKWEAVGLSHSMTVSGTEGNLVDPFVCVQRLRASSAVMLPYRMKLIHESGFGLEKAPLPEHPPKSWPVSGLQSAACIYGGYTRVR